MTFSTLARLLGLTIVALPLVACGGSSDGDGGSGGNTNVSQELKDDACNQVGLAKIANGNACTLGEDPAASPLVKLDIISASGSVGTCTGLVVEDRTVLTAGHCLQGSVAAVGVNTFGGETFANSILVHPGFDRVNSVLVNDYALVFTNDTLNTAKASLLLSRPPAVGEEIIVAGFGETSQGSGAVNVLHAGAAVITQVTGQHVFISFEGNQSHPCGGDSGGPIFVKLGNGDLAVAGLVSQSDPSVASETICRPGDLTIYGSVQNESVLQFLTQGAPNIGVK